MNYYSAITIVVSVFIVMKFAERIIKNWSHKKTVEKMDFEMEVKRWEASNKIAEQNFNEIVEEIRDMKGELQEIKDLSLSPISARRHM